MMLTAILSGLSETPEFSSFSSSISSLPSALSSSLSYPLEQVEKVLPADIQISVDIIKIFLVLIILTAAFITVRRDLISMINIYSIQSFLIVIVSLAIYYSEKHPTLIYIALITLVSKVIAVPFIIKRVSKDLKIKRDVEFHYLTPTSTIFVSILILFFMYGAFSDLGLEPVHPLSRIFTLAATLSISLVFMGMIIIFTRKQTITDVIGYLTMENGVVLFSLFVAELPMVIEVMILLDLVMLILLLVLLGFGIDSSIEEFHAKLDPFRKLLGKEGEEQE
ncbi:hydrogenase subunit [Candidatus Woesearchaeota archaeon]|nr:hydrogenase subunit [Candidatus Woesearchaeota archaeon]